MQVLNVIEIKSGIIQKITSFVMPHKDDSQHPKVNEAEQLLVKLANDKGNEDQTDEDIIQDGYFEYGNYEVHLMWSEITK